MSVFQISLFGKFQALRHDVPIASLEKRKVQELLAYLVLYRERPHPRETLAGLLWGDMPTGQSKKYLRQTLWQINGALQNDSHNLLLQVEADWVCLHGAPELWVDAVQLEEMSARLRGLAGQELDAATVQALQSIVALYQGELLEGWYQDWCIYERERFQMMYLAMLDKLVLYFEARQDYETAHAYGMQILKYDRASERTHRRLMRLLYLAGDRTGALRQYDRCVAALAQELNVKPSERTRQVYEQVRRDELPGAAVSALPAAVPDPAPFGLSDILARLKRVQVSLAAAHTQVQQDIQAIERKLSRPS